MTRIGLAGASTAAVYGALAIGLGGTFAAQPLAAQKNVRGASLDRTVIPAAGKTPALHVPSWTKSKLPNGAELVVSERHGLPLVSLQVNFIGGAYQYEPADKTGLATFTAGMMSEGTTTRTGDEISNELQALG
ncbi:MAG: hypothetical protein ABI205_07010, partial [Gemmatimonadaceae bacterium]